MAIISINPNTQIKLVKVPLETDYKNTFTFSSLSSQSSYFNGLNGISLSNYTYVRKDQKIRIEKNYDEICNYNYLFYDNNFPSSKRYYCFITRMEYINENATDVYIMVDSMQTYFFDIVWNRCFVEREHVNDDTFGLHTIPEDLNTGEYINCLTPVEATYDETYYVVAGATENILTQSTADMNPTYNGVPSGLIYIVLDNATSLWRMVSMYSAGSSGSTGGKLDSIQEVFMIPSSFITGTITWNKVDPNAADISGNHWTSFPESNTASFFGTVSFQRNLNVGTNYTPKNKKLLCYPYSYLLVSNNAGADTIFRYEDFAGQTSISPTINFDILASVNPGCSIKIVPLNYKNYNDGSRNRNYEYSINGGKFPVAGWIGDVYLNWLTQNGVNIGLNLVNESIGMGTNVGMLETAKSKRSEITSSGNIAGGITSILGTMADVYKHSLIPDSANGNTGCSDVMFALKKLAPTFYRMSIKDEMAKVIDDYFSMFGYKVNTVKIPNITGRSNWNYVKTIDCNCDGDIPNEDLNTIRNNLNNGITFWHYPSNIYRYDLNNAIL